MGMKNISSSYLFVLLSSNKERLRTQGAEVFKIQKIFFSLTFRIFTYTSYFTHANVYPYRYPYIPGFINQKV